MKMKLLYSSIFLFLIIILLPTKNTFSQVIDEITAISHANRTVLNNNKEYTSPEYVNKELSKDTSLNFTFYDFETQSNISLSNPNYAKITIRDPKEKLKKIYTKIGIGNYLNPYVDLIINSSTNKTNNWSVNLHHFSANVSNNIFNFMENKLGVEYNKIFDNFQLGTKASYELLNNNLFIYDTNSKNENKLLRKTNIFNINLNFNNKKIDSSGINYLTNIDYYNLNTSNNLKENNIIINSNLYKIINNDNIGLNFNADLNIIDTKSNFTDSSLISKINNTVINILPYIKRTKDKLTGTLGLNISFLVGNKSKLILNPNVEISYDFHKIFLLYGGIRGKLSNYKYNEILKNIPYVDFSENLTAKSEKLNLYFGFRGNISNSVDYNFELNRMRVNDMQYLYLAKSNLFDNYYTNSDITNFKFQLNYNSLKSFSVNLISNYHIEDPSEFIQVTFTPKIDINISLKYLLKNKILFYSKFIYLGEIYNKDIDNNFGKMDNIIDANIGAEYYYNHNFSLFLNINNISGKNYFLYDYYNKHGVNVLAGFTYKFY